MKNIFLVFSEHFGTQVPPGGLGPYKVPPVGLVGHLLTFWLFQSAGSSEKSDQLDLSKQEQHQQWTKTTRPPVRQMSGH